MRELVLSSCRADPSIRDRAIKIATGLGMRGPLDAAGAFECAARDAFTLIDEPEELLIDPSLMFHMLDTEGRILGDCDDAAMFVACLTYSIGLPTRFKAITKGLDGSYQHVFTEYMISPPARWIPLDPTIEGIPVYARGDCIVEEL